MYLTPFSNPYRVNTLASGLVVLVNNQRLADRQDLFTQTTSVPEPGTLALLALSLVGLVWAQHRKRRGDRRPDLSTEGRRWGRDLGHGRRETSGHQDPSRLSAATSRLRSGTVPSMTLV